MPTSWAYDAFPLRRADSNTRGDDYQYVVQSLDASIRHVFGLPTGVSLTPAFSIDADGNVEILKTLKIGSAVEIDEIVASIPSVVGSDEDEQLATVEAIRAHIGVAVLAYLQSLDQWVEKAGDTMTGALVANGGITATTDLELENALFTNNPRLDDGIALEGGGKDLIQYDSAVLVGDTTANLKMVGSNQRPLFNGANVALVSDITGSIPGIDYVPEAGGDFLGLVGFLSGLYIGSANPITMQYAAGASDFALALADDTTGEVTLDSGNGVHGFTGSIQVAGAVRLEAVSVWYDVLEYVSSQVRLGHASLALNLLGSAARPLYNGSSLALLADVGGAYIEGSGIDITAVGPNFEISIETNGINASHMPIGDNGDYARLDPTGVLVWDGLDIVAGTGMVVAEHPTTKQVTVSIDNLGVDTAQLADDAVTQDKVADAAIGVDQIDTTSPGVDGKTYSLTVTDEVLDWVEGSGSGGGFLSTVEILDDNIRIEGDPPTPAYVTEQSGSSGPYIIEDIYYYATYGTANHTVSIQVYIDGALVLESGFVSTPNESYTKYPYYANDSFEIKAKASVSAATNQGGYIQTRIQRLA